MQRAAHRFFRASAFLTRFPARASAFEGGPHPLGRDALAFPFVGLAVALPPALILLGLAALGLQPFACALIALLLLIGLTGALHEDGLADTADGLFGHATRERALEIMKDSRIGTYGALALIGALSLRAALLADLTAHAPALGAWAMLVVAGASRGAMAWLWSSLPSARPGGLSNRMEAPFPHEGRQVALAALGLAVAGGAAIGGWTGALAPTALALCGLWLFRRFIAQRLGGTTGDTLGAAQQIVECLLLLGLALAA
ncbi:hypothetical protein NS226_12235 [Aureimonas ureilytica]|uniref:Adenosylcobinamide-GDP ribazoletransferase n=1 Tax=Aureimonas ureilytica TaxID=401562 RepID=A0A175R760_9HYPH|nr:adenosylcobinamide-GDP ribazoletransferase [Aureimonas ureilytica]KTQ95309.1 hypothetical protein NS226_12235 [Aureimonas ureilytica]